MQKVYVFTDSVYPGISANKIVKMNMALGFCALNYIKEVNYTYLINKRAYKVKVKHRKLKHHNIFIPYYKDESRSPINKLYRLLICKRLIDMYFFQLFVKKKFTEEDFIYIRGDNCQRAIYLASLFRNINYSLEIHNYTFGDDTIRDYFYTKMMQKAKLIITVSKYTKNNWVKHGIDKNKILVLPSGVSKMFFKNLKPSLENKNRMYNNDSGKIILYSGQLQPWSGIETFLNTAKQSLKHTFYILGGDKINIQNNINFCIEKNIRNVKFLGNVKPDKVPEYLQTADLLVISNAAQDDRLKYHISPLKLGEYIASKKPVVASDLPSIRQFVNESEITYFKAGDYKDLALKIKQVFENDKKTNAKIIRAYKKAKKYTWDNRVDTIIKAYYVSN